MLRPYLRRPFWSAATDLMVVVDEVALPLGTYRFRAKGSAGGHNGLKSIEAAVKSQEYPRLRIGIAPDDPARRGELADYVLDEFGKREADGRSRPAADAHRSARAVDARRDHRR